MRILLIAAAAALLASATAAQGPGLGWVNCRVIAPSTLQLIWHGLPWGRRYEVSVATSQGRTLAIDTTADTTFTRASLPAGSLRIVVLPLVRGVQPISATVTAPVRAGFARCAGT